MGLIQGKIGGTDVSAIVGQNPWRTRHSVWLELTGKTSPTPDNERFRLGRLYEPKVAGLFEAAHEEYDVLMNADGTEEIAEYVYKDCPAFVAHPDRILRRKDDGSFSGLEIKTSNLSNVKKWGDEGENDAVPIQYLIQCHWYMGLTGFKDWWVAVSFLDDFGVARNYRQYRLFKDDELFDELLKATEEFYYEFVKANKEPPLESVDETTKRWVNERFAKNLVPIANATPQEENVMAAYIAAKEEAERAKADLERAETMLKTAIGERDGLQSETFGKVTWKLAKDSSRVDYKAVCEELAAECNASLDDYYSRNSKIVKGTRRFVASGLKVTL